MAVPIEDGFERKNKRKRRPEELYLPGERVEVRSLESGFEGSWHSGLVTKSSRSSLFVEYDDILVENGSEQLSEEVLYFPCKMGISCPIKGIPAHNRCRIRPIPPRTPIREWALPYGLCVDALHNDAWWEGVVFDHEDGATERLILFPDLGDEMNVGIDKLRITQDWDEVSEKWKCRGNWLFFELIEKHEKQYPLLVSVRQLWYDVRTKEEFQKQVSEWTFWVESAWNDLVFDTIVEYIDLTLDQVLHLINLEERPKFPEVPRKKGKKARNSGFSLRSDFSGALQGEAEQASPSLEPPGFFTSKRKNNGSGFFGFEDCRSTKTLPNNPCVPMVEPSERYNADAGNFGHQVGVDSLDIDVSIDTDGSFSRAQVPEQSLALSLLPSEQWDTFTLMGSEGTANESSQESEFQEGVVLDTTKGCGSRNVQSDSTNYKHKPSELRSRSCWLPVSISGPEYHPDRIQEYLKTPVHGKASAELVLKLRKHLLFLGWRVESRRDSRMCRISYVSPSKRRFPSLRMVCNFLSEAAKVDKVDQNRNSRKNQLTSVGIPGRMVGSKSLQISSLSSEEISSSAPASEESSTLDPSPVRTVPMDLDSTVKVLQPECCPQAVISYSKISFREEKQIFLGNIAITKDDLILKAKKHLLAIGWKFDYYHWKRDNGTKSRQWRYISPEGKTYYSLRSACAACVEECKLSENISTNEQLTGMGTTGEHMGFLTLEKSEFEGIVLPNEQSESSGQLQGFVQFGKILSRENRNPLKLRKNGSFDLESNVFLSQTKDGFQSWQDRKHRHNVAGLGKGKRGHTLYSQKLKKGDVPVIIRGQNKLDDGYPTRVLRSSKRARKVLVKSPSFHTPLTVLSWLIDNDMVLPRAKVRYICRKDPHPKLEGRITRDGIKCGCCQKVFTLSGFETHADSMSRHAASSIFLEDGRSLLDCQAEMLKRNKMKSFLPDTRKRIKSNRTHCESDSICSVCHYGGTLILCDQCPSSFHLGCIGLEVFPKGDWFCPSCRCCICGQSEFDENVEKFTDKTVLCCDQCEQEYHVGCLKKKPRVQLESALEGNWFCSKKCEKIFVGLHKLLGKSVALGIDNLTWTVLKATKDDSCSLDKSDMEAMIECNSKLNVALTVMHECFEPVKETATDRDLFEDVIFCRGSELNRLNFHGFYTVLLGRKDELISVATFRVFGENVAEIPLVGTRVQYRRRGMCRLLMNELEKKLMELGVQRLLLPAIPQVLHAWTTSFGFSKMAASERMKLLGYTILNFPDTTMCQKILVEKPAHKLATTTGNRNRLGRMSNQSDESINFDRYSIIPGPVQADKMSQKQDVGAGNGNCSSECLLIDTYPAVLCRSAPDIPCLVDEVNERKQDGDLHDGSCIKYYTRRKT